MAQQTEFDRMIISRASLNESTINNYKNSYARLLLLLNDTIENSTDEEIINAINSADITESAKITLLIVATNIVSSQARDTNELLTYRSVLNADLKQENANKAKTNKFVSGKVLIHFTDKLFEDGKWKEFIVNYLLINFGVRNQDLDLIITRNEDDIVNTDNWIVLNGDTAQYIRYKYKTADQYGARTKKIFNKKFITALNSILGKKSSKYLMAKKNGERVSEKSIGTLIKRMTLDDLGEGKYFKIMLRYYGKEKFESMCATRGTSINTAIQHYDQDFTNAFGKEAEEASHLKVKFV